MRAGARSPDRAPQSDRRSPGAQPETFGQGSGGVRRPAPSACLLKTCRAATHQIRRDLMGDHFEGSMRLSDPVLANQPPREGFFMIKQFGPSGLEGTSSSSIGSYRAPGAAGQSHVLYMTVRLKGNRKEG